MLSLLLSLALSGKIQMQFYAESLWGDCKAHAAAFGPTVFEAPGLSEHLELTFDYIGGYNDTGFAYCPPHGSTECVVDKYNLCAQNSTNDNKAVWTYMSCLYENQDSLKCGGEDDCCDTVPCPSFDKVMSQYNSECALKANLTPEILTACAMSEMGDAFQRASYEKTAKAGIEHPSWVWINGELFNQPLGKTPEITDEWANNVLSAVCDMIDGPSPEGCKAGRAHIA